MNTHNNIELPKIIFAGKHLIGEEVNRSTRRIKDLQGVFGDEQARQDIDQDMVVYDVYCYFPVAENTPGGLFFGITHIFPGLVGNEYFMTKGHFHLVEDRAEFYWGIEGEGMLLLMDKEGNTRAERMFPGSLHYIPGHTAHRVANTGNCTLSFGASWPSDSGHNYGIIQEHGFSKRLLQNDGIPRLE